MPPDRTLPDILMPGNGGSASPRPWGTGTNSQNQSPISPVDGHLPFERTPQGGAPSPVAPPQPTYQPDGRVGRRQDANPPEPLDQDSNDRHDSTAPRERSRPKNRSNHICNKCGDQLTGQFVRALGGTFHLECFKCNVCICHPPRSTRIFGPYHGF